MAWLFSSVILVMNDMELLMFENSLMKSLRLQDDLVTCTDLRLPEA